MKPGAISLWLDSLVETLAAAGLIGSQG